MSRLESKSARFCRLAEARVNKIVHMIRLLGNCSSTSIYEFCESQVEQIFNAIDKEIYNARTIYKAPTTNCKSRFSLTDNDETETVHESYPMVMRLPDKTHLRAVAIDDENFPAINIYWDDENGTNSQILCFAEYNPERDEKPCLCIGAYQSDSDETKYYMPYMAERK